MIEFSCHGIVMVGQEEVRVSIAQDTALILCSVTGEKLIFMCLQSIFKSPYIISYCMM